MGENSNHLDQKNIDRLNKIITDLRIDQGQLVDIIEELGEQKFAASNILNAIMLLLQPDKKSTETATGLAELLEVIHPLIYGGNE